MEKFRINRAQTIGLFVLLTLIAIFVVINFLRGQDIFNRNTKYYTVFEDVEGLTTTGPVYIRGLKVGMVESIKYNNEKDNFIVKLSIKSDYALPSNSTAEVYSSDIMGSKAVRIKFGTANTHAKENDTLAGNCIPDMVSMLSSEIGPIKDQVAVLMDNLNKTLDNINTLLDTNARENLQASFANLNKTLANAKNLSAQLNDVSPDLKELVANLNVLSKSLSDGGGDINSSLENINKISTNLAQANLTETIENLSNLLEKLQDPNGSLGKLMATDSLHNSLDKLLQDVDNLVNRIKENPKKYIKISVF